MFNLNNKSVLPPPYRFNAFTLAEVLITLVIIGVIAALTVPTLIAKYNEQQTVSALKKFYSEISQAYASAISDNGEPESWQWDFTGEGSERIMNIFAPHLRIMNRCGIAGEKDKCFGNNTYKTLNPSVNWAVNPSTFEKYSSARLDNGFLIWIHAVSSDCSYYGGSTKQLENICGYVGVDINGYKKPNALGKDTFYFWLSKSGAVIPFGAKFDFYDFETFCNKNSTNERNGYACNAWIIEKGNMKYLYETVSL